MGPVNTLTVMILGLGLLLIVGGVIVVTLLVTRSSRNRVPQQYPQQPPYQHYPQQGPYQQYPHQQSGPPPQDPGSHRSGP